jgi:hypothetical protein
LATRPTAGASVDRLADSPKAASPVPARSTTVPESAARAVLNGSDMNERVAAVLRAQWWRSSRASLIAGLLVGGLSVSGLQAVASSRAPGEADKRIRELHATQAHLYAMVAAAEGQLESQRHIYMARIKQAEALLRERERELRALRAQLPSTAEAEAPPDLR